MDTWTLQTGFPLITVNRNYAEQSVEFTQVRISDVSSKLNKISSNRPQERFILLEDSAFPTQVEQDHPLWWIPITYTTQDVADFDNTKPDFWMRNNDSQITMDLKLSSADWFIINLHQTGYYRVNYDNDNWKMIIQHLQDNETYQQITASNRAQLIDDAMNLARAGYINYSIPLDVTTYLKHETDYVPWKAALNSFSFIDSMLIRTANYELFRVRN